MRWRGEGRKGSNIRHGNSDILRPNPCLCTSREGLEVSRTQARTARARASAGALRATCTLAGDSVVRTSTAGVRRRRRRWACQCALALRKGLSPPRSPAAAGCAGDGRHWPAVVFQREARQRACGRAVFAERAEGARGPQPCSHTRPPLGAAQLSPAARSGARPLRALPGLARLSSAAGATSDLGAVGAVTDRRPFVCSYPPAIPLDAGAGPALHKALGRPPARTEGDGRCQRPARDGVRRRDTGRARGVRRASLPLRPAVRRIMGGRAVRVCR